MLGELGACLLTSNWNFAIEEKIYKKVKLVNLREIISIFLNLISLSTYIICSLNPTHDGLK